MPLGKRADFGDARYAGAEVEFTCDIIDTLQVCAPLFVKRKSFCTVIKWIHQPSQASSWVC